VRARTYLVDVNLAGRRECWRSATVMATPDCPAMPSLGCLRDSLHDDYSPQPAYATFRSLIRELGG
jgi:hypothetical protein